MSLPASKKGGVLERTRYFITKKMINDLKAVRKEPPLGRQKKENKKEKSIDKKVAPARAGRSKKGKKKGRQQARTRG